MDKERKKWIDVLKGLAIVLVVIQHSCGSLYNSGLFTETVLAIVIRAIGVFHMALFMELSGAVFRVAYIKAGVLDKRKVQRQIINLCILYLVYSGLRFVTKIFFNNEANSKIQVKSFFEIPIKALDELWFLYALIIIYCLCYLLLLCSKKVLWQLCFFISVIYFISGHSSEYTALLSLHYICFFVIGLFYKTNKKAKGDYEKKVLVVEVLALSICLIVYNVVHLNSCINNAIELLIAFLICNLLFTFGEVVSCSENASWGIWNVFAYFGKHSLPIYLLHVYLTAGLRPVIRWLHLEYSFTAVWILSVAGIIIPLMLFQLLKILNFEKLAFHPMAYYKK